MLATVDYLYDRHQHRCYGALTHDTPVCCAFSVSRGPFSRAIVVAAGVVVNFTLAWACIFGSVTSGGIVQPHYDPGLLVNQVRGGQQDERGCNL